MRFKRALSVAVSAALLAIAALVAAPMAAQSTPLPNSRVGIGVQWYYGTNTAQYASSANQVDASGVDWVRIDLRWRDVQSGGATSWNWTETDKQVAAAVAKGLKVLLLPSYSPDWANGNTGNERTFPTNVQAWKDFLTAAWQRYLPQGVTTYELWNEPNLSGSSPALYTSNILIPGAQALRAASVASQVPVTILSAAPASVINNPGIVDPYAWTQGVYAAGGKDSFDALALHPYMWPADPTVPSIYNHLLRIPEIRTTMTNNGDGAKQVWATEFGFPTGYGSGGNPNPPGSGTLISGLENVNQWTGEAARTADTANKTEGSQSIRATYAVPAGNGWSNFSYAIASPYLNLSTATSLKVDLRPTSQTPSGQQEPIQLKIEDNVGNVIYEQRVPRLTANTWTTVTVDLTAIPAGSRGQIKNVNLYLYSGFTAAVNGRTSIAYSVDNLRYEAPSGVPSSGLLNGLENVSEWGGEAAKLASTSIKTQGAQSIRATYTVPSGNGWANFVRTIPSPYVNLSTATSLKIDLQPTSQTPSGQSEPIQLKIEDNVGNVIYEQRVQRLTANTWTTITIPLSAIPAGNRSQIKVVNLYLYSGFTAAVNGRTSIAYYVDNIRYE